MAEEKFYITEEGLQELKNELDTLLHHTRQEVIEELKAARAQGDLSENADYDAARDRQARVEARIKDLDALITNAEIIDDKAGSSIVKVGSQVKLKELDTNNVDEYTIVGTIEADPLNGKLSNQTPLAQAILDHKVGAVVTVDVDEPYDVEIISIK